jgi:hypothetical protein
MPGEILLSTSPEYFLYLHQLLTFTKRVTEGFHTAAWPASGFARMA